MAVRRPRLGASRSAISRELTSSTWQLGERLVGLLNGAVAGVFVARALGPATLAEVSLFTALVYLATPFITAVQPLMVIALGRGRQPPAVLASGRRVATLSAGVATACCLLSLAFVKSSLLSPKIVATGGILILTLLAKPAATSEALLQHNLDLGALARRRSLLAITAASVRIIAAACVPSAALILLLYAVEQIGQTLIVRLHPRVRPAVKKNEPLDSTLLAAWKKALAPTFLATAGVVVYMRTDQVLLTHYVAANQVGQYAAAATLAEAPYFLGTIATNTFAPRLTQLFDSDPAAYARLFRRLNRWAAGVGITVTAVTYLLAGPVVAHLQGSAFPETARYLRILSLATPFVFLGVVQSTDALLSGQQRLVMIRTVVAGTANIATNLVLLSSFGTVTAAWTTVGAQALASWLLNASSPRTRGVFRMQCEALSLGILRSSSHNDAR